MKDPKANGRRFPLYSTGQAAARVMIPAADGSRWARIKKEG